VEFEVVLEELEDNSVRLRAEVREAFNQLGRLEGPRE